MTSRFLLPAVIVAIVAPTAASAQFSESFNFLKAVRERDGSKVTAALNKPGSVMINTRDAASGETPLHIVAAGRDALWLGFLLQRGANPDARNANGETPLMLATQMSATVAHEVALWWWAVPAIELSPGSAMVISS